MDTRTKHPTQPSTRFGAFAVSMLLVIVVAAIFAGPVLAVEGNAPRWKVAGALLGNGATKSFSAKSTTEVTMEMPGWGVALKTAPGNCTITGTIVGSGIHVAGTANNVKWTCTGLTVVDAPKCTVSSGGWPAGTVVMGNIKSKLVWLEAEGTKRVGELFEPSVAGGEWTSLVISGSGCGAAGAYPLKGQLLTESFPVNSEALSGALQLPPAMLKTYFNNETPRKEEKVTPIVFKSQVWKWTGSFSYELAPAQKFGIYPG